MLEFLNTGDIAALDLWHEYERETVGLSSLRFTKGLRALLIPEVKEKTDEELAAEAVDGTIDYVFIDNWLYWKIVNNGLRGKVIRALSEGGIEALARLMREYHLSNGDGSYEVGV